MIWAKLENIQKPASGTLKGGEVLKLFFSLLICVHKEP